MTPQGVAYQSAKKPQRHSDLTGEKFQKISNILPDDEPRVIQEESIDVNETPHLMDQHEPNPGSGYRARSGREVRKPKRFQDDDQLEGCDSVICCGTCSGAD